MVGDLQRLESVDEEITTPRMFVVSARFLLPFLDRVRDDPEVNIPFMSCTELVVGMRR